LAESQGSSTRTKKEETAVEHQLMPLRETVEAMLHKEMVEVEVIPAMSKPNLSIQNQVHHLKEEITRENNQRLHQETMR